MLYAAFADATGYGESPGRRMAPPVENVTTLKGTPLYGPLMTTNEIVVGHGQVAGA